MKPERKKDGEENIKNERTYFTIKKCDE